MVLMTHNTDFGDAYEREVERSQLLQHVLGERLRHRHRRAPVRDDALGRPHREPAPDPEPATLDYGFSDLAPGAHRRRGNAGLRQQPHRTVHLRRRLLGCQQSGNQIDRIGVAPASQHAASRTSDRRPVTFALNFAASGLDPATFRATNVAIHIACGLLLFGLVRRTLLLPTLEARLGGVRRRIWRWPHRFCGLRIPSPPMP